MCAMPMVWSHDNGRRGWRLCCARTCHVCAWCAHYMPFGVSHAVAAMDRVVRAKIVSLAPAGAGLRADARWRVPYQTFIGTFKCHI